MNRHKHTGSAEDGWPIRKENLYRAALAFVLMWVLVIGLMVTDAPEPLTLQPTAVQSPTRLVPAAPPPIAGEGSAASADLPAWARPLDKERPPDGPSSDVVAAEQEPATGALIGVDPAGEPAHGMATNAQALAALARAAEGAYTKQAESRGEARTSKALADVGTASAEVASEPAPAKSAAVKTPGGGAAQPKASRSGASGPQTGGSGAPFRIRLGDFGALDVVQKRLAELVAKGYPVVLQIRVAAGPYSERRQAEEAIAKLRREHGLSGLLVAGPTDVGALVQLGVFSDAANAAGLAQRLSAWGYPAAQHARLVIGPYPNRAAADLALRRLREEGAANGAAVVLPSS